MRNRSFMPEKLQADFPKAGMKEQAAAEKQNQYDRDNLRTDIKLARRMKHPAQAFAAEQTFHPLPLVNSAYPRHKCSKHREQEKASGRMQQRIFYSSSGSRLSISKIRSSKARVTSRQAFTPVRSLGLNRRLTSSF